MVFPFVEHVSDVGGERRESDQMFSEQLFAFLGVTLSENATGGV